MKNKILALLTLSLSSCATTDWSRVNFAPMQNYLNQQNQGYYQPQQSNQVDLTCMNQCSMAGYNMVFCRSRCSY